MWMLFTGGGGGTLEVLTTGGGGLTAKGPAPMIAAFGGGCPETIY